MSKFPALFLLCFCLILRSCRGILDSCGVNFVKHVNVVATDSILASTYAQSVGHCSAQCTQVAGCNAFNIGPTTNDGEHHCDMLVRRNSSLDGVVVTSGWQMYVDEFIDNPQAAPCPRSYVVTTQAMDVTSETDDVTTRALDDRVQSTDATAPEGTSDADVGVMDCSDLVASGSPSGVYLIRIESMSISSSIKQVYCDMDTDGGGWTVITRRFDGSQEFNYTWDGYKHGFGDVAGEYWLGNEYLHYFTSSRLYELRFDMESFDNQTRYATYAQFNVSSETDQYRLNVSDYIGDASDDTADDERDGFLSLDGLGFSTSDRDNDRAPGHCATNQGMGGFWLSYCARVTPTNAYCTSSQCPDGQDMGIIWGAWLWLDSLKTMKMMMRPA